MKIVSFQILVLFVDVMARVLVLKCVLFLELLFCMFILETVVPNPAAGSAHPWSVGVYTIPSHINMVGSAELSDSQRRQIWEQQQVLFCLYCASDAN